MIAAFLVSLVTSFGGHLLEYVPYVSAFWFFLFVIILFELMKKRIFLDNSRSRLPKLSEKDLIFRHTTVSYIFLEVV